MPQVISKDGTSIAFENTGNGAAVILVDGAMMHRELWGGRSLAAELAKDFTVFTYDRRGRGESGDTKPYSVEREIEDIEALVEEAGGSTYLYGVSSGAALALKAATRLGAKKIAKLALYEPPFNSVNESEEDFARYVERINELLKAGKHGEAVAFFLSDMMPPEELENLRQSPEWSLLEAVAPTLAYDNQVMGNGSMPVADACRATMPALILDGDASPNFLREAADRLAKAMPHAGRKTLKGQPHIASTKVLSPALTAFFKS